MKVKLIKHNYDCIDERIIGTIYQVLAIEYNYYRLISDIDGLPYLYFRDEFEVVDYSEPDFWIEQCYDGKYVYKHPKQWNIDYFFEKFHDDFEEVRFLFYKVCKELYKIDVNLLSTQEYPVQVFDIDGNILDEIRPCLKKTWYLEPTETENTYKFIYEHPENINLTIGKKYKMEQHKDIWYKVIDNLGKEVYFPTYMFE